MAKLLKLRRGTTTQHGSFTGAEGEVTIDTDKDVPVVHDGSTQGGHPVAAEDMSNVSSASIAGRLSNDSIATSKIAAGALPSDVTIENANVTSSAAIAGTKIAPDFGSQDITTTGTIGSSNITITNTQPFISFQDSDNENDFEVGNAGGTFRIRDVDAGINRLTINSSGTAEFSGNLDVGAGIDVTGNMTVTGTVDGVDVVTRDTLFGGLTSSFGVLSDGVTATTQAQSDDSTKVSTTAYVRTAISEAQAFPSGTKMLFQQTTAPTGWTKVTSGVDNKALRVVSGTVVGGGSNAFSNTLADRGITANSGNATAGGNISVSVGNTTAGGNVSVANAAQGGSVSVSIGNTAAGGNVNSHTLSVSQMPSHSHSRGFQPGQGDDVPQSSPDKKGNQTNTGSTGGSGGHSHGFSGSNHNHNANANFSGSNHNHNATFSGTEHNHNATASFTGSAHNHSISVSNLDMAVAYLDVIIAQKD